VKGADTWGGRRINRMTLDQARAALIEAATQVEFQKNLAAQARREVDLYRTTIQRIREGKA
jgi:hypothetical protein